MFKLWHLCVKIWVKEELSNRDGKAAVACARETRCAQLSDVADRKQLVSGHTGRENTAPRDSTTIQRHTLQLLDFHLTS